MNCTDLLLAAGSVLHGEPVASAAATVPIVIVLALVSASVLLAGVRLYRPAGAAAVGVAFARATYDVPSTLLLEEQCIVHLGLLGIALAVGATAGLCLLDRAINLLGAVALGTAAHFGYTSLVSGGGVSVAYYYATVAIASFVGGVVLSYQREAFVIFITAGLGAAGLLIATHMAASSSSTAITLSPLTWLGAGALLAVVGVATQYRYFRKRRRRRPPPSAKNSNEDEAL